MNSLSLSSNLQDIILDQQTSTQSIMYQYYDNQVKMQVNNLETQIPQSQNNFIEYDGTSDNSNQIHYQQQGYMPYLTSYNVFNEDMEIDQPQLNKNNLCQTLSLKTFIIKTKRSSSKRFKRKQYQSFYAKFVENQPNANIFLIFGYIQIENNYLDFSEQNLDSKSQLCDRVLSINHVINNKMKKRVEFYLDPIGRSGMTNFNDLISQVYSKQMDEYSELAQELICYQSSLSRLINHMNLIKRMVIKKVVSENTLLQAFDQSHNYFLEYLNQKHLQQQSQQLQSFTHTLFFRTNISYCDREIYQSHYSYQFLQFLGIDPEDSKNHITLSSPYQVQSGLHRLKNTTTLLKVINSKQKFHKDLPFYLQTKEGIQVNCTIDVEVITFSDRPVWMSGFDNFMLIINFNINPNQLDFMNNLREQKQIKQEGINKKSYFTSKGIEEQAQFEIFLEKYYANNKQKQV